MISGPRRTGCARSTGAGQPPAGSRAAATHGDEPPLRPRPPPWPLPVPESDADHGVVGDAYLRHSPSLLCPVSIAAPDAGDCPRWALQLAPILTKQWHAQPEHLEAAGQALNASAPSTAAASSGGALQLARAVRTMRNPTPQPSPCPHGARTCLSLRYCLRSRGQVNFPSTCTGKTADTLLK